VTAARIRLVWRPSGPAAALSPFMLWSVVGHVVLIAALMLAPSFRSRKPFPDNPIVVNLVAAARPEAPSVQTAAPAPAAPETAPEGVRLEAREPEVKPLPKKDPPKKKEPPKKKTPAPTRPAAPPPETPRPESDGPSGPAGPGGDERAGSITALEGGDVQFAWYRDSVTAALYSQWRRPILTGLTEPVEVRITFEILRDGSVRSLAVDQSSGLAVFDRSALRAVSDAAPLPPLPTGWGEPTLPATFVFQLFPD